MKKALRFGAVVLFISVAVLGFISCGNKDGASAKSDAKIVYWTMWNETEPQGQVIAQAVDAYTKKTGIPVEVNWNGREIRKTLQPALDTGTAIDLFDEDIERVNQTWGAYLLPVEDMAAQAYDTTGGQPFTSVVNKPLIDLARSLGPNGQLSTIPYQPSEFVVMYNKDIFKDAGITSVPKTWPEFLAACEKIKAIGKTPITVDDAYIPALVGYHLGRLIGGPATVEIVTNDAWDNPAVLQLGKDWEDMYKKGYISRNAAGNIYPAGQQEIANESVAMYLNGTWLPNEIKDSARPDFPWGSFAYPAVNGGVDGPEANNFGSQCFGINKNSKYPQETFDLIVFLTTGDWDVKLAQESLGVPMANDSAWPVQLTEAKAVLDSTTKRYPWAVGMENDADQTARIKSAFASLISGKTNGQCFADAMKKK